MLPPTLSSRINSITSKEADEVRHHSYAHSRNQYSKSHNLDKKNSEYDDEEIEVDCYGAKKGPPSNTSRLLRIWILVVISFATIFSLVLSSSAFIGLSFGQNKSKLSYIPSDCLDESCSIEDLWSWASKKGIVASSVQIANFPCPTCGMNKMPACLPAFESL